MITRGQIKAHCGSIAQYVGGARRSEGWCLHRLDGGERDALGAYDMACSDWLGAAQALLVLLNEVPS